MALRLANPDRLFDRTWRPRHPLRPNPSPARKWIMFVMLLFLYGLILGYNWLTNPRRVRDMAGAYLSDLLGGEVSIGKANLSIFEGLRLDDVTLRIAEPTQPDSTIFHAQTFLISYRPGELLAGRLAATRIIAVGPIVMLAETPQTGKWNYQRLPQLNRTPPKTKQSGFSGALPQIILRDAQVAYMQVEDGKAHLKGWYGLEAQLSPVPEQDPDHYDFTIQTRGREELGPSVEGTMRTDGGASVAQMRNFTFGQDIKTMLLEKPRAWCEWHQLEGRMDVPQMRYTPGRDGAKPTFSAEINLGDVELAVHPEEWMSREQNDRVQWFHGVLDTALEHRWLSRLTADMLRKLSTPQPIHLRQVSGKMVFNENGIELSGVNGKLEGNWFAIDGKIDGYTPDAPADLTLSSVVGHDLEIPAWSPTYVGSLPMEVQEICERLHPQGTCSGWLRLQRAESGATPVMTGRVDIHDGHFTFIDCPYPLSRATGTVLLGPDPIAQMEGIRVLNVRGYGLPNGPNADAVISLDGFIGPLHGAAGVWLDVHGAGLKNEPAFRSALPVAVDRVLHMFDPEGKGELPTFTGDFTCHIMRPIGSHKRWTVSTDVTFEHTNGMMSAFAYPIRDMSGRLEIREGVARIIGAHMAHGDGAANIDGQVTWKTNMSPPTTQPYGPDLKIVAKNLPIDQDLENALPAMQRRWLQDWSASGALDIDGHVFPSSNETREAHPGREIDYTFDANLHDGSLRTEAAPFVVSKLSGQIKLTPDELLLNDLSAVRGSSSMNGYASIHWDKGGLQVFLAAAAQKLALDDALKQLLPSGGRDAWDQVHPQGTVDASMRYQSATAAAPDRLEIRIRPHDLTIQPQALPYRLDQLQGLVEISPEQVVLTDIKGRHGDAEVAFSGSEQLGPHSEWNLKLSTHQAPVDSELITALPQAIADVVKGLKLQGKIDLDFSKLAYRPAPASAQTRPASGPAKLGEGDDMDFAATLKLTDASMDVGLHASEVSGTVDLAGLVRGGKLYRLAAQCASDKLKLGGRPGTNFKVTVAKSADDQTITLSHLEGQLAGGDVAGDGQIAYPDDAPGHYDLSLVLRDADVQQLEMTSEAKIKGRLTASLEMGGNWNSPDSRRGHGDVSVHGQDMYDVPIVQGLLQITNLDLPFTSPFSEATTRYNIDGQKISFEKIDLKSKDMTMSGSGELDFAAKKVSLWFVTDNPTLVSLPVVGPLIHGAKQELLKIHVTGTMEQPKVSASSFDTIKTTVDRVFNGEEQK